MPTISPTASPTVSPTIAEKIASRAYVAVAGLVTTVVTQLALRLAWRVVAGGRPPEARDRAASFGAVLAWAVASGAGVGVAKVLNDRRTTVPAIVEHAG